MRTLRVLAVAGALSVAISLPASAHTSTGAIPADHPLIGTWVLDLEGDDRQTPSVNVFGVDGIFATTNMESGTELGVWEAVGDRNGDFLYTFHVSTPAGAFVGMGHFWATLEVLDDGDTVEGGIFMAIPDTLGEPAAWQGPFTIKGKRFIMAPREPVETADRLVAPRPGQDTA